MFHTESNDNAPTLYEVLFDEEFLGGLKLRCSSNRAYRLPAPCLLNISHGKRLSESDGPKKISHKSHTSSGTSYANAASGREQQQSYGRGQSYGNVKYQSRKSVGTETEYGSRSERSPKSGRGNGRGRGTEVKKIMQRNSSDSLQTSKQESGRDELSVAVDALSKLSVSDRPAQHETKDLSPSVAAMFSAHKQQDRDPKGEDPDAWTTSVKDHSSNLKSMIHIGGPVKSSPTDIADGPQLSQPLAPLLPQPPQDYQPQRQPRGELCIYARVQ